jgi:hypothetical protein
MERFSSLAMSAAMAAAFLLLAGGVKLIRGRRTRTRGALMIVAALVIVMNVLIWTI